MDLLKPISDALSMYTRTQRESELWKLLHGGSITSSSFGEVLRAKSLKSLI